MSESTKSSGNNQQGSKYQDYNSNNNGNKPTAAAMFVNNGQLPDNPKSNCNAFTVVVAIIQHHAKRLFLAMLERKFLVNQDFVSTVYGKDTTRKTVPVQES
jgi:hypothetical protein